MDDSAPGKPLEVVEVDFSFRRELADKIEGNLANYCYQCGACVGDCPATTYSNDFNPRKIMLQALLGQEDVLIGGDSVIWLCTNCYTCYERCPQDVRPIEVIIALKNLTTEARRSPEVLDQIRGSVRETGRTVAWSALVDRRRQELGLEKIKPAPVDEIQKLLDLT